MTAGAGGATLTLKHLTLTHGNVTTANCYTSNSIAGGGLCSQASTVTLVDSAVIDNTATNGGGIAVYKGALTLTRSTVSGNTALKMAGGVLAMNIPLAVNQSTIDNNVAGLVGAGILGVFCQVSVTDSTVSGNIADTSVVFPEVEPYGRGGGIMLGNCFGTNIVTNSTITGNWAISEGGGIYAGQSSVQLNNVTLTDNSAATGSGIFLDSGSSVLTSYNSILANNDIYGGDGLSAASIGNLVGAMPGLNLGALADNGGPTWTMLPQPGSVAIDAGDSAHCQATDQRGYIRPDPGSTSATPCDIGAVETDSIPDEIFADGFDSPGEEIFKDGFDP